MVQENRLTARPGKFCYWLTGHVEGDFSKNRKKETTTKDCTEVKADKETTSDIHEEKRSES